MKNPIIEMSFLDDDFSSHINLTPEEVKEQTTKEIVIPSRYDINRLVILPVNPNLIYTYWFTQESLKKELSEKYKHFKVVIKLNPDTDEEKEIEVGKLEGQWYINYHAPFKKVKAVLGLKIEDEFIPILHSNEIVMPSDTVFIEDDEHWYNRNSYTVHIKKAEDKYVQQIYRFLEENPKLTVGVSSFRKG